MNAQPAESAAVAVREVVTAFVWDGRRVLLALRSRTVSTFPGHWGAISGYVEGPDPRQWALVEIAEECGVDRRHLTLRGAAPPLTAADPRWGTFHVHPLLFTIDDPQLVRPDWEASRFEWVDLAELQSGRRSPLVPRLLEAFAAVWPPWDAPRAFEENRRLALDWLRQDRSLGAGTLARAAAWELAKLVRLGGEAGDGHNRRRLLEAIEQLQRVRPAMAAPANLMTDIASDIAEQLGRQELDLQILAAIAARVHASEAAQQQVAQQLARQLAPFRRPMTISRSATVLAALLLAAAQLERVFVCEGRPLCEGRSLAADLHREGVAVTVLTDAQAWTTMPQADCVVVGADAVLVDGDVVNKCGTGLLALAARRCDRPLIVAAESLKWERTAGTVEVGEENPPAEVWPDAPPGIAVLNRYFDRVPADLISQRITEDGPRR